jgi:2-methylisocitrate lyase-like PEP mutase family enzyme
MLKHCQLQEHQLEETLERVALYEKNGANGIFVPLMSEKNTIHLTKNAGGFDCSIVFANIRFIFS